MSAKITILSENVSFHPELESDFGISIWIETQNHSILMDTGTLGKCFENARKLNIDLSRADAICFSHGHCDHTNGLMHLAEEGITKAPVYLHRYFFNERYWDKVDDGGYYYPTMSALSPQYLMQHQIPFKAIYQPLYPLFDDAKIWLLSDVPRTCIYESICPSDVVRRGGDYVVDDYRDEMSVVIEEEDGLIILSGCGHNGLINICTCAEKRLCKPVKAFIGGTHLMAFPEDRTQHTLEYIRNSSIKTLAVGHCTGPKAMERFAKEVEGFIPVHTGTVIEILS